ncbi:MAG TPA: TetR/AcrR family transcriptional regulator [Acidimicrobiales bacterium]|nr:TetR/AcrR family transcriptional regulator [Acidimicrobiales bacterium]
MNEVDLNNSKVRRGRPASGAQAAILASALELIKERGLAHVTTREVARRAGVSEASVFYHFHDKVGLLQAVVLAGLLPLEELDLVTLSGSEGVSLADAFFEIGSAFESFFDRALPVCEAVHADTALRGEFAARLVQRDLGPHRGVELLETVFAKMANTGRIATDVDLRSTALLLIGAAFLRSWSRHLSEGALSDRLPTLEDVAKTLAGLLGKDA